MVFNRMQPKPASGPSHSTGSHIIHGIAKGSSSIPDSPESAGFLEAMKYIQQKTATASSRNRLLAITPARDLTILGLKATPRYQIRPVLFFTGVD